MRAENALDFSDENRADFDEFLQKFRAQRARKACKICAKTSSLSEWRKKHSGSVLTLVPHVLRAFCADLRGFFPSFSARIARFRIGFETFSAQHARAAPPMLLQHRRRARAQRPVHRPEDLEVLARPHETRSIRTSYPTCYSHNNNLPRHVRHGRRSPPPPAPPSPVTPSRSVTRHLQRVRPPS